MKNTVKIADGVEFGTGRLGLIAGPRCGAGSRGGGARARYPLRLQGLIRQGQPHVDRRVPRPRSRGGPRYSRRSARYGRCAGTDRRACGATDRSGSRSGRRVADSGVLEPADRSSCRRSAKRPTGQRELGAGASGILLTERGTSFGYNDLVVDFKGLCRLADFGHPVVFDVTHSLQLPGAGEGETAGERRFAEPLARAAAAVGVDVLFVEVHDDPSAALSDGATQLPLERLRGLLEDTLRVHDAASAARGTAS